MTMGKIRKNKVENAKHANYVEQVINEAMYVYANLEDGDVKDKLFNTIIAYLGNNGFRQEISVARPLKPEYKALIRDDCDGSIASVNTHFLSKEYLADIVKECKNVYTEEGYKQALSSSAYWKEMNEFDSYHAIRKDIVIKMAEKGLELDIIGNMSISEFRDFVRSNCHDKFIEYRQHNNFVKSFAEQRGCELEDLMLFNGVNITYTHKLLEQMRLTGTSSDIACIDKNGHLVTGPNFEKHHSNPVYSPEDIVSVSEVNNFNKLVLMERKAHRRLHKLEKKFEKDGVLYYSKISVPENTACIINFETIIKHDFEKPDRVFAYPDNAKLNLSILNKLSVLTQLAKPYMVLPQTEKAGKSYINHAGSRRGSR